MLPSLPQTAMRDNFTEERVYVEKLTHTAVADEVIQGKTTENGDLATNKTVGKVFSLREEPVVLQWGQRKRPRCSRMDNHPKNDSITDEAPVLLKKMARVKAEKVTATGTLKVKNGLPERPHLPPSMAEVYTDAEEGRKRAKILRGEHSDRAKVNRGAPSKAIKGACSSVPLHDSQEKSSHPCSLGKTRTSPDCNTSSPCRSVMANGGGMKFSAAKVEINWPKLLISLSRKEKEDDFFVIKGTKLPQRPKRRPKVVERAIHFCTPGSWLTDLSRGRYEVREKKCVKKKPTGLKAMDSVDSDSE